MSVELILPWPPTVNHYWEHRVGTVRGRQVVMTYIGQRGVIFRHAVIRQLRQMYPRLQPCRDRIHLTIKAHPPTKAKRDLSNLPKAVEDALTHAQVWVDDEQVDHLEVVRGSVHPRGKLVVTIDRMPEPKGLFDGKQHD